MRFPVALAAMAVFCVSSTPAQADEFGARFYGKTPAGIADFTAPDVSVEAIALDEKTAAELQEIAPAAGNEQEAAKPAVVQEPKK